MQPSSPPKSLGPYTAWTYGPGRSFDFFASFRADAPHVLTGIIERPGGHHSVPTAAPLAGGGLSVPLLAPTLWSGLAEPQFVPFVMDGETTAQSLTDESLDALFAAADTAGLTTPSGALGPASAKTRISAGAPIRADSVTPHAGGAVSLSKSSAVGDDQPLVVIGIIDDGIPFAHRALAGQIEAVWLQGMAPDGSGRVRFGRELTAADIEALVAAHGPDEDAIYRAAGALGGEGRAASPLIAPASHGAHTLGTLAQGSDAQTRIIAVDLPPDATWDTSGHGKEALILSALHYIFDRADALAAAHGRPVLPLVVNFSYGYSGGSHDGTGILEAAMDELFTARRQKAPTALTMPSGNMYVDRTYAEFSLKPGTAAKPLAWCLPPDDRTSTFLEVWLPKGADASGLTLKLHGPAAAHGAPGPVIAELEGAIASETELRVVPIHWQGKTVGQLSIDCMRGGRWRILAALAPTEAASGAVAPAGRWHVALHDTRQKGADVLARLRIQRDISYGRGFTGARQSYFDDPENALFDAIGAVNEEDTLSAAVKRAGSFNGMAAGKTSLVVGAGAGWGERAELYSGAPGKTEPSQVDLSALVSTTMAEPGRLSLAARSGARHRMTGTSAAAPAVGAALRDVISAAQPGDEAGNYLATLDRAGRLEATAGNANGRLGSKALSE